MYHLTINQKTIAIPLSFTEAAAWQQALRGQFSQENIEITGPDGQPVVLCIFCEQPAPATNLLGDWEVCEVHAHSLTTPDPLCAECGEPLSAEDIEAGETICAGCAPAASTLSVAFLACFRDAEGRGGES